MQKSTPFLWFDSNALEAVNFYTSVFKNSRINIVNKSGSNDLPGQKIISASFSLDSQEFTALNGSPQYTFSPAIFLPG